MEKKFRILGKGITKEYGVYYVGDLEESVDFDGTPSKKLSEVTDEILYNKAKRVVTNEDLKDDELWFSRTFNSAYVILKDLETGTEVCVKHPNYDYDEGSELYVYTSRKNDDEHYVTVDETMLDNEYVIEQILEGIVKYSTPVLFDGDTIEFTVSENVRYNGDLIDVINLLGIADKFDKETLEELKNNTMYMITNKEEYEEIEDVVQKAESKYLNIASLCEQHKGNKLLLVIDWSGWIAELKEVDAFDDSINLDSNVAAGSLIVEGNENDDNSSDDIFNDFWSEMTRQMDKWING